MLISMEDRKRLRDVIEKHINQVPVEQQYIYQVLLSLLHDLAECEELLARKATRKSAEQDGPTELRGGLLNSLETCYAELSDSAFQRPDAEDIDRLMLLAGKVPDLVWEIRRLQGVTSALLLQTPESARPS